MRNEVLVEAKRPCGTAVLVLAGSSGALEVDRARLLAHHGATALALRWFGGVGQQPGPYEVPLETFAESLDRLAPGADRLAVLGTSFGAEAALLLAARDVGIDAVVAFAPTAVVWAGVADDGRVTSHWTHHGEPVPFVPFHEGWQPDADPPAYRGMYERSLLTHADAVAAATIPVETTDAHLVLVAGGDDQVWPADDFARAIATRRLAGQSTRVLIDADAGHRAVMPGEAPVHRGQVMARGGTPEADRRLGAAAWPVVVEALGLRQAR